MKSSSPLLFFSQRLLFEPNGCWNWLGSVSRTGYGRLYAAGKQRLAHRFAYTSLVGPIPAGLTIDHLCRNRRCVNPRHMEPVTQVENVMRGVSPAALNVGKTVCDKGHPYTSDSLYVRPNGDRECRICSRFLRQQYNERYPERVKTSRQRYTSTDAYKAHRRATRKDMKDR